MNDKLAELIKVVFDQLESLDEVEFKKNLSKYYNDPLTELLLQSDKFKDNSYESPYIPFLSHSANVYESTIAWDQVVYTTWSSNISTNVSFGTIGSCAFQTSFQYVTSQYVTSCILNKPIGNIIMDEWKFNDDVEEGYLWAKAA